MGDNGNNSNGKSKGCLSDEELIGVVGGGGSFTDRGIKYECTHNDINDYSFLEYYNRSDKCHAMNKWCDESCTYFKLKSH